MALQRVLWLSLISFVALAQATAEETTRDYNIYYEPKKETTRDYNIYYENRPEDLGHPFVIKPESRQENLGHPFVIKPGNRQEGPDRPIILNADRNRAPEEKVLMPKRFEETNPTKTDDGRDLFDGDILLTEAQWREVALRKGLSLKDYLWPEGTDGFPRVPYRFGDEWVDQNAVRNGIAHWESNTCIKFEFTTNANQPHLKFIKSSGCYSYIGYMSSYNTGQDVSIGNGCTLLGIVAHEIGHAMGFFHEQSRPERDSYVRINTENIIQGYENNFRIMSTNYVDNKGVPYDFTSDMHYGGSGFTRNDKMTIVTLDPLDQELIGKRDGLSHRDKLLANRMYGCIDKWLKKCEKDNDPCMNGGYTDSNCECVCPPGTSGFQCESVNADYYAAKRTGCSEKITSPGTVTSPNYPSNYPADLSCAKWIVAPTCKAPKVTFTAFRLVSCTNRYDQLEIRTTNRYNGDYYCGTQITPGTSFTSTTNELILMFYTRSNYETGWSADITFVDLPNCNPGTTTTPAPTTTQPATTTTTTPPSPSCTLEYTSTGANWLSPNFGSENYLDNFMCGLKGSADKPMKAIFQFSTFKLQPPANTCVDYVSFQIPYSRAKRFCGEVSGSYISPNLNMDINFKSDASINDIGFNISVSWDQSDCHKVIELSNDDSAVGYLKSPNYPEKYPKQAVCEWWLVAPEGRKIQLEFTTISLLSKNCKNSYIAVDKAGTAKYNRDTSVLLCPKHTSASVKSDANIMNVAFAGGGRRSKGFKARYTLV